MRIVKIPKKKGRFRTIYVPNQVEKAALRSLLPDIVRKVAQREMPGVIHGFMPGRSPVTNAMQHRGFRHTWSLDLQDFFDTVTPEMVPDVPTETESGDVVNLRVYRIPSPEVCSIKPIEMKGRPFPGLCRIKVANRQPVLGVCHSGREGRRFVDAMLFSDAPGWIQSLANNLHLRLRFIPNLACYIVGEMTSRTEAPTPVFPDGAARQGLPTSPAVANLAACRMDHRIAEVIRRTGKVCAYTRYADDLTFSFDDYSLYRTLRSQVPEIAESEGFTVNPRKYRMQHASIGRRIITGFSVDQDVKATRELRRRLRAARHQRRVPQAKGLAEVCKAKIPRKYRDAEKKGKEFWDRMWETYRDVF